MSPTGSGDLLGGILRDVSRSFYLTLRALPGRVRRQIGVAYLLARTTDTIADTEIVPVSQRLEVLRAFRERIGGGTATGFGLAGLAEGQSSRGERVLIERAEDTLRVLQSFDARDRGEIVRVLEIIVSGQEEDLRRFSGASVADIRALESEGQLDDYTYKVAGCVGEFWTRMCRRHVFPKAAFDEEVQMERAVRFGKGLQLVNVLRDISGDLRMGRCYMPASQLARAGLGPAALLNAGGIAEFRPVCNAWIERAEAHLREGWHYTNALPFACVRVRLACAWPLLIGLETLKLLRTENLLDPARRIKVSRHAVRSIIRRTIVYYPWPGRWKKLASV